MVRDRIGRPGSANAPSRARPPHETGVILGIAVLLDAMLVRLILIPALLRVFGRWAWALPRWLDRLLPGRPLRPRLMARAVGAAGGAGAARP
jgi:uncharacterized membrane protein YdfJ with MMPL/SSD domain